MFMLELTDEERDYLKRSFEEMDDGGEMVKPVSGDPDYKLFKSILNKLKRNK